MTLEGRDYALTMGSDVARDGMFLELDDVTGGQRVNVGEWFYSDVNASLTFTAFRCDVPAAVLDWFRAEAARRLPPRTGER